MDDKKEALAMLEAMIKENGLDTSMTKAEVHFWDRAQGRTRFNGF